MAPQQEQNKIYPCGQQLWNKIPEKRGIPEPHKCTPIKIRNNIGLDRESLQWHHIELGLKGQYTGHIHVRICQGISPQVPAPHSSTTSSLTPQMEPLKL